MVRLGRPAKGIVSEGRVSNLSISRSLIALTLMSFLVVQRAQPDATFATASFPSRRFFFLPINLFVSFELIDYYLLLIARSDISH
jgi:hypothetical protein